MVSFTFSNAVLTNSGGTLVMAFTKSMFSVNTSTTFFSGCCLVTLVSLDELSVCLDAIFS